MNNEKGFYKETGYICHECGGDVVLMNCFMMERPQKIIRIDCDEDIVKVKKWAAFCKKNRCYDSRWHNTEVEAIDGFYDCKWIIETDDK